MQLLIKKNSQSDNRIEFRIFCIAILLSVIPISVGAQSKLVFSTAENSKMGKLAENILRQAYNTIGMEIEIVEYPALRAIITANEGKVNGELMRIKGIEKKYTNLMMIPVSLAKIEGVVFTKNLSFRVAGFKSLKSYKIAIRRGIKFAERGTEGMNRTILDSLADAFLLLNKERVNVVIATRHTGLDLLNKLQYQGIKVLEPPLMRIYLYHYLHKKHKALVPKITASLQEMQKDGTILKEQERFLKRLLEKVKIEPSR